MPEISDILSECFESLSKEYEIEKVDYLPFLDREKHLSVPVWHLTVQAVLNGTVTDVAVFIAFPKSFPFSLPWVVVPDERLKYLPHISLNDRKVCLYADDVVYDTTNIYGLIKETISRTRRWIHLYSNQDNTREYASEINSYWAEKYDDEKALDSHWILLGEAPNRTCELKGMTFPVTFLGEPDKYFDQVVVFREDENTDLLKNIKNRNQINSLKKPVLYIHSFTLPKAPPYSMTTRQLLDCIKDDDDRRTCKRVLNKYREGHILFPLGPEHLLGGVTIPKISLFRKGFRVGTITAIDVLTRLEYQNKHLVRLKANIYDNNRIAKRTAGNLMEKKNLAVVGLGSIGSNLCYYLNGYNNVNFSLIDTDSLTIDNMGRHLLGFSHIDQRKVNAVADYLTSYRPDRKVSSVYKRLEDISVDELNKANAIFVCTGNIMSEKWLLDKMNERFINVPSFILWLEPYGVSGIMVYVNPRDIRGLNQLLCKAKDGFLDYCLIHEDEYRDGKKLIQRDAGCNGEYALYSANDVTLFLSAMFPHIDRLLSTNEECQVYQWIGNTGNAVQRGIMLSEKSDGLSKNMVLRLA